MLKGLIQEIPAANRLLLGYLISFLDRLQERADQSGLNERTLGNIFGPTIMRTQNQNPQQVLVRTVLPFLSYISTLQVLYSAVVTAFLISEVQDIFGVLPAALATPQKIASSSQLPGARARAGSGSNMQSPAPSSSPTPTSPAAARIAEAQAARKQKRATIHIDSSALAGMGVYSPTPATSSSKIQEMASLKEKRASVNLTPAKDPAKETPVKETPVPKLSLGSASPAASPVVARSSAVVEEGAPKAPPSPRARPPTPPDSPASSKGTQDLGGGKFPGGENGRKPASV